MNKETLIKKCVSDYQYNLSKYQKMEDYYKGNSDAQIGYKIIESKANNKIQLNFIKKFLKNEVSYGVGQPIDYISRSGNKEIIKDVVENMRHWSEKHDQDLMKEMLKFSEAYELYYIDKAGKFSAKILTPLNCYILEDDYGEIELLIHFYSKRFDDKSYYDVHYADRIETYQNNILIKTTKRIINFGSVPAAVARLSKEKEYDTLYNDIKSLVDSLETNLSDSSNEISDFRNSILLFLGVEIDDNDVSKMKLKGALQASDKDAVIKWLEKNVNDSFTQNTITNIKELIYELSDHINVNQQLQSNTSSLALKTRLINLNQKVKLNCDSLADCIKTRLKFLCNFLKIKSNKDYNYLDLKPKFTMNIPSDDLMIANIISQIGDKISTKTAISQLSFIDNADEEMEKLKKEQEGQIDLDLISSLLEKQEAVDADE